jgi:nicotinate-nucleotide adenylyltransferase
MQPRRRRAIFGGSFNPPHVGHQLVCAYVLATARPAVDVLWMVPTFHHPFGKSLAPYDDRVAMCERAAAIFGGRVEVSRIEEELGGESFTLHTVKAIRARYPDDEVAVVIGADLLGEREHWHGWPELQTLTDFIVVGRSGAFVESGPVQPELELPQVSSTDVRGRLANGRSVDGLVPTGVADYIVGRGLYRGEPA